jgi:hypothetical protein
LRFVRSKNVCQIKHKTTWICLHGPSSPSTHFLELSAPFVRKTFLRKTVRRSNSIRPNTNRTWIMLNRSSSMGRRNGLAKLLALVSQNSQSQEQYFYYSQYS